MTMPIVDHDKTTHASSYLLYPLARNRRFNDFNTVIREESSPELMQSRQLLAYLFLCLAVPRSVLNLYVRLSISIAGRRRIVNILCCKHN